MFTQATRVLVPMTVTNHSVDSVVDKATKELVDKKAELGMEFILAYQSGDMARAREIDAQMKDISARIFAIHPRWNS